MPVHRGAVCSASALRQFIDLFETRIAPLSLAGSWDNVGLLIEPPSLRNSPKTVSDLSVFLCIDLTSRVLSEAVQSGCNLIVTYHPILFTPTQSLTPVSQNVAVSALVNGIAVFSPHTALDSVTAGINDHFLDRVFGESEIVTKRVCCFTEGESQVGRVATLLGPLSLAEIIRRVKQVTGCLTVRYALPLDGPADLDAVFVTSAAFCAGAGASVLKTGNALQTDCVITGELSHHDILFHISNGRSVVLTEHSNCERPFLKDVLCTKLEQLGVAQVVISRLDQDPIRFL